MFTLIKNADIYAPQHLGINDILICNRQIVYLGHDLQLPAGLDACVFDAEGLKVVPGFIDQHVHVIGGGGQLGFASLVPAVTVSELVEVGTTTVVGLLGTDGFVKDLGALYAAVKAICQEGLSSYMLTSYYGLPERTLTGSVAEDLIYIDKVIGCKLAMSDDRSSFPTTLEILRLINQVRLGGFTSGKGGVLHIHLGAEETGIAQLIDIVKQHPKFADYLSPTHLIRTRPLFEQALEFASLGGMIDFSTGGTKFDQPRNCVMEAVSRGISIDRITFSSDGHGGVRKENPETGEVIYRPAPLDLNFREMTLLVKDCGMALDDALKLITTNPARNLKLKSKGRIAVGMDADLCFLDDNLTLQHVMAMGRMAMMSQIILMKGRYE